MALLTAPEPDLISVTAVLAHKAEAVGKLVRVEGNLTCGYDLAYLTDTQDKQARIRVKEQPLLDALQARLPYARLVGSDVAYYGYAQTQGVLRATGFSALFQARLQPVSWFSFRWEEESENSPEFEQEVAVRLIGLAESVSLSGVTHLTPRQVQALAHIMPEAREGCNFPTLRARWTDGQKHLVKSHLGAEARDALVQRLREIGIDSLVVEYDLPTWP